MRGVYSGATCCAARLVIPPFANLAPLILQVLGVENIQRRTYQSHLVANRVFVWLGPCAG